MRPKLDQKLVENVRKLLARGEKQIDIAKELKCSQGLVSSIKHGRYWGPREITIKKSEISR